VGAAGDKLKVAAVKTDQDLKWNPIYYNTADLQRLIKLRTKQFPKNRILMQLAKCSTEYHCLTAQNIFYQRWEAGIPVSPVCNANCLGCISKQPAECCPSPQGRIEFIPTIQEITELAVNHLETAGDAIISFGQGCEGEPSLQRDLLVKALQEIRKLTSKGTININSNAGYFDSIRDLVDNGLDSIRVSLFSACPGNYEWYHNPAGYQLADVKKSLQYASDQGVIVALNLLLYPGFTNQAAESNALYDLISQTGIKQVQLRNLNLDPEKMGPKISNEGLATIQEWMKDLTDKFPKLIIGNYTQPKI
jgi:molybdenum cofactor biosynthesis enzyme MoaA